MTESLKLFFSAWELFRDPALTGTIAGAMLGLMGVYVVLRRMVFLTAAVSHAASLGVALAFFLQVQFGLSGFFVSPWVGSFTLTIATLMAVNLARRSDRDFSDAALGFAYLLGAAGTLALGTRIVVELHDINTLLFGTAVAVVPEDFRLIVIFGALTVVLHAWLWRGFSAVSFDREDARVRGLPVRVLEVLLLALLALAISLTTRVIGALPTFAFSVLPALVAIRVARNVPQALLLATAVGAIAGFSGYVLAFIYELPVGAAQTLVAATFVVLTELSVRGLHMIPRRER